MKRINESPYDKKLHDLSRQMNAIDKAPKSKIQSDQPYYKDADGRYRSSKEMTWQSAEDVAKSIGASKVFKAHCDFDCQWSGSDYVDGYSKSFDLFFYANYVESAKEMLKVFKEEHDHHGYNGMDLSHTPNYSVYEFSEPTEVLKSEAEAHIAKSMPNKDFSKYDDFDILTTRIHYLPTRQIVDEMKASVEWATKVLKSMKDIDERKKREEWLKTEDGQAWKAMYDEEQALLKKVDAWNQKHEKTMASREAKVKQQKADSEEVLACFEGKSTANPQYNFQFVPVEVSGGKKFNGNGYVFDIDTIDGTYGTYDEAKIYCPAGQETFTVANLKYCRLDTSVSPERCKMAQETFYEDKAASTLAWCRKKDPSKSEAELNSWAANICKKYIPGMDVGKYFGIADLDADKAESTAKWACGLSDVAGVSDAERIIERALAKKGIDAMKYKDSIKPILLAKFGKAEKFN